MNINNIKKEECCGCGCCLNSCPKKAISMCVDEQGFMYPKIENELCVDCGICYTSCIKSHEYKYSVQNCYAVKNKDKDIVLSSSSGGVVDAFSKAIFKMKGVVYGATYNQKFELIYKRAENLDESIGFRGSKYVQADLKSSFHKVYMDLKVGRPVLFIGTSCYVAGLRSFLDVKKCDISNLFTIDFICHGVPSPGLFKKYVKYIDNDNTLQDIQFRNKKNRKGDKLTIPWKYGKYNCALVYKDGKREINTLKSRIFLNMFTSNNCLRPHCYQCEFIGQNKSGDITVADYWGIDDVHSEFADNYGVSAVMIHTAKGQVLFDACDETDYIVSSMDKISLKQGMLHNASPKGACYDKFWIDYCNKDFEFMAKKYGEYNIIGKIRQTKLYSLYSKIRYGNE